MKAARITVGVAAFLVGGGASFLITRGVVGAGARGGLASREGLVAATIEGVNAGDRAALLAIMVGPASDRLAAECDDAGRHDADARAQRRGERVDDALGEARRRKLVLDHIGDDHAEVVAKSGDEIDKHCRARLDVVTHAMELALHDGKNTAYTAHLTAVEVAGRWFLAKIPVAEPVGSMPAVAPAAAPPDAGARTATEADMSQVTGPCATYVTELKRIVACSPSEETRAALTETLRRTLSALYSQQTFGEDRDVREALDTRCEQGLDTLRKGLFGC